MRLNNEIRRCPRGLLGTPGPSNPLPVIVAAREDALFRASDAPDRLGIAES